MIDEIGRLLQGLHDCTGDLVSDHDLNLLMELQGSLSSEFDLLKNIVRRFQALSQRERFLFIVGRRTGMMRQLDDLNNSSLRTQTVAMMDVIQQQAGGDLQAAIQALRERMV